MILSGAIFGDLCDFEAIKIGKQLGTLGVQWQLHLMTALEAGFEGSRHEVDMETYVRFARGRHGVKTSMRTQNADEFPWRRTFSHAQGQWQSSSDKVCRSRVQTVRGPMFFEDIR